MTSVAMIAARMLPSSQNSTAATSRAPSARFFSTVPIVASTSSERSRRCATMTPGGSASATSSSRSRHARGNDAAVAAGQHQDRADDDLVAVLGSSAGAQVAADADSGDIAHRDWQHRRGSRLPRARFRPWCECAHRRGPEMPHRRARRSWRRPRYWPAQAPRRVRRTRCRKSPSFAASGCDHKLLFIAADGIDPGNA